MAFDAEWFDELRSVTRDILAQTTIRGIHGLVPNVDELNRDGHVTDRFVEETHRFVCMFGAPYQFDEHFRAYPRHIVDWPPRRAFRKQWNIGFTAGGVHLDDYVRLGIGFRLSARPEAGEDSIMDYVRFREDVRNRPAAFDGAFQPLRNYYDFIPPPEIAVGRLSDLVIADNPPPEAWRFFGRCLWVREPKDNAVITSHERLRDVAAEVFRHIQAAGLGM